jgi:hypothetical protein
MMRTFSNLLIGKSHLGDFGRSIAVFGFYVIVIELAAVAVAGSAIGAGAAGAISYVAVLGMMVSVPAALIYFGILFFARALNKASLRNVAIVWFFAFPALVLAFISQL